MIPLSLSTRWNAGRHQSGQALIEEILELGLGIVELGYDLRAELIPGVKAMVASGAVRVDSVHNFCPVPIGAPRPHPELYTPASPDRREREFAKQQHRYYFEQQGRANNVTGDQYRMELFDKDFNVFEGQVFSILIQNVGYEESQLMYGRAPDELRVYAYDMIVERYRPAVLELTAQGGKPFDILYPEPPGMAEHRIKVQQEAAAGRARLQNEQK